MDKQFPFSAIPTGWFQVGLSRDLGVGQVLTRHYFDQDIVLYRTKSGEFRATEAFCPHLGAHMGQGEVAGEHLRCAFHGFEFNGKGRCTGTPYETGRPPRKARLKHFPVKEVNGLLLAWHDALDREPTWDAPELDLEGYTDFIWHRYEFSGHPQETSENSVDVGHFSEVHGFRAPEIRGGLDADGPLLRSQYHMNRKIGLPGTGDLGMEADFDVFVYGLGYSLVKTRAPGIRMESQMLINATPVDMNHIHLNVGAAIKRMPIPGITAIVHRFVANGLIEEVGADVPIWEAKRYEARPALAEGDGEIAQYRRWASQFYPEIPAQQESAPRQALSA